MSNEERRKYPRIEIRISIQGRDLREKGSLSVRTHSNDLSAGGVRFITNKFISLACRFVLEMNLPTVSKPVKAISKVAWIRKRPDNNAYDIGNQFLEISREDKDIISEFVNSRMQG